MSFFFSRSTFARVLLFALGLVLLLLWPSRAVAAGTVERLANGLTVVLLEDPAEAGVSVVTRYDAGSRDEPQGLNGLAHLVEHLVIDGTRHLPRGRAAELLESAGAWDLNARTTEDATIFHETVPPGSLELALWIESERLAYPLERVDVASFDRARQVVERELDARLDRPWGGHDRLVYGALFPAWHPYHRWTGGTHDEIDAFRLDDARAFARTWYVPRNATLAIVGRFTTASALALVHKYFDGVVDRPTPQRPPLPPHVLSETSRLRILGTGLQSVASVAWLTEPLGTRPDAVLDLLARVLQQALNRQLGGSRAPRVVGAFERSMQYASIFSVQLRGRPNDDPVTLLAILSKALQELTLDPADMAIANERWLTREAAARDSTLERALRLAHHVPKGDADWVADPLHARVTSAELEAALRGLLARPRLEVIARGDLRFPPAGVVVSPNVFGGVE